MSAKPRPLSRPTTWSNPRILLVDDDPDLLHLLGVRLRAAGFDVAAVASGEEALARLPTWQPQLVITDLRMGGIDGMALFDSIHKQQPSLPVVVLTAHGTIPDAVEAIRRGVFCYLTKPFESKELLDCVGNALRLSGAAHEVLPGDTGDTAWREDIITRSHDMEGLLARARLVARSEASILIQGASGTGKELLARAIHRVSHRAEGPFVAVNTTAIPESLMESELFGHVKGAFTGAARDRPGLFQQASGGTLFLDEIGDMPLTFQAKLLRALQEREVRPVGSDRDVPFDVRVISATHHDLEEAVAANRFREDLYYRLNVVSLRIPNLAERRGDIPLLVSHFLHRVQAGREQRVKGFSPEAMEVMVTAPWPGNVRQLENVVEQVVALSTTNIVPATLVEEALRQPRSGFATLDDERERFEREYLVRLLEATEGNVSRAARIAGRERSRFYKLLKRHQLDPAQFRPNAAGGIPEAADAE
jgi:two-component system response regulator GlrR